MLIKDRRLTITAVNTTTPLVDISFAHPYDAQKNINIQQVVDILNATAGFVVSDLTATSAPLGAIALIEGDYVLTPDKANNVKIFTSVLWAVFRPLAYVLQEAKNDIDTAIQQVGFVTAQGDFLDYWGTFFNIPRYSTFSSQTTTSLTLPASAGNNAVLTVGNTLGIQTGNYVLVGSGTKNFERVFVSAVLSSTTLTASLALNHDPGEPIAVENGVRNVEPDYEYSVRLLWETIKPRVNNKAIEELLFRGTGYNTTIVDMSSKVLLADGYPTPVDKDASLGFSDNNMVGDGFITSTKQGFPEDDVRYGLGERYNFGSIGVFVDIPIDHAFYPYTTEQIQDIVERHRAAGTTPWFTVNQVANEVFSLVSEVVTQLQGDIQQDIDEGRAMLFGYDDFQFYADHTDSSNVNKMPWEQSNLDKPSLSDGVVMQSGQKTIPAQYVSNNEAVFIDGPLADGYLGGYNRNLLNADTNSSADDYRFRIINSQTLVTPETTQFIDNPVLLNYQRFSDEYITPRVLEGFSSDILQLSSDSIGTFNLLDTTGLTASDGLNADTTFYSTNPSWNFAQFSESFTNPVWFQSLVGTATNATVTPDAVSDSPRTVGLVTVGKTTADRITFPTVDVNSSTRFSQGVSIPAPTVGSNYCFSIWLRADSAQQVQLLMKKISPQTLTVTTSVFSVTTTWQRFNISGDVSVGGTDFSSTLFISFFIPAGSSSAAIYSWGAKVNVGTTPIGYNTTNAAANPFIAGQRVVIAGCVNTLFNQTYSTVAPTTHNQIRCTTLTPNLNDTSAFRLQINGGTSTLKYLIDAGILGVGSTGFLGLTVKNNGPAPLVISDQYTNGPTLQAGQQTQIALTASGSGSLDFQVRFQTLSSSDNIDCIVNNLVFTINGANVAPSGATQFASPPFIRFLGASIPIITPGFPTPKPIPFADAGAGGTIGADTSALSGLGDLTNVAPSTNITVTTPLVITAPTGITGVKFDSVALTQANIRNVPLVVRNLEIPNFGDNWNTNYSTDRYWIVPLQDVNGNVYYMTIAWPYATSPLVPALRIFNPTASISSDNVQIQSGDTINITWAATNSNGVVTLRRETIATGVIADLPVSPTGTAQFSAGNAVTQNTRFHLIVNGNNGQTAEAICTITVVAARTNALPPTIALTAQPDVVELCDSNQTAITYSVNFNSRQTEVNTIAFPANANSIVVTPLAGDPVGTTILAPKEITPGNFQPRQLVVTRASDGVPIPGAWTSLETGAATFIPVDPTLAQGHNIVASYDVNYGGSFLQFQGSNVPLPNNGNVFSITQTATVTLPPPPFGILPQTTGQQLQNNDFENPILGAFWNLGGQAEVSTTTKSKNLLAWSELLNNPVWSQGNLTVTLNATTDPFGGNNASKLAVTATTGLPITINNQSIVGVGATGGMTYSVYLKQGSGATIGNVILLRNATTATNLLSASINLTTGVVTGPAGASAVNVGNGWWRFIVSVTSGINNGDTMTTYLGWVGSAANLGDFVFAFGAQLEASATATTYVRKISNSTLPLTAHSGTQFLRSDNTNGASSYGVRQLLTNVSNGSNFDFFPVSPGDTVNISGWLYAETISPLGNSPTLLLRFWDAFSNQVTTAGVAGISILGQWIQSANNIVTPAGAVSVTLECYIGAPGSIGRWDDLVLTITHATQPITTQYVANYSVTADNYATVPVTTNIPVYVHTIQQGAGSFNVEGITAKMLPNFDFESGAGSPLDPDGSWKLATGTGTVTFNTSTPIFGTRSLQVAGTTIAGQTNVTNAYGIGIGNNFGTYTLTLWASVSVPGVIGQFAIQTLNANGTVIGGSSLIQVTSTTPTKVSVTCSAASNVTTVNVLLGYAGASTANGFVLFDDVVIIPPSAAITEAIGPTVNQTIPITLTGTGFSSKMQVFVANKVPSPADPTVYISQLVQANITSIDWQAGVLTFIAPRLTFNVNGYPVIVNKLDCLGNVLETNSNKVLIYNRSDYRDAPIIDTISPSTVCLVSGFLNKQITLTGKFFRPGAIAYVVTSTGIVAEATTVLNLNNLTFTMDRTVAGSYDIVVENTDTSSGATKGQPLVLMPNNTTPSIDAFGYVAPTSTQGCAYYGTPFTLHWSCTKTSSVSFLSSDPLVQSALQPPPSTSWPPAGSVSVVVNTRGTTITVIATNDCNNTASQVVTINDLACDRTLAINVVPTPVLINNRLAYKVHTHRTSLNEVTGVKSDIDISDDAALSYSLVDANDNPLNSVIATQGTASQAVTLVDHYITANKNGIARIKAYWNGFQAISPIYVQIPVPISLNATPTPIIFSNIGQVFQLAVTATYSDGSVKTVTNDANVRYLDYDVKVCSVTTGGTIVTNALGTTYVHCSYFDSIDPTVVVSAVVQVGLPDNCVGFERLFVQPAYAVAGNIVPIPVSCAVTGVNGVNNTVMPDTSGIFTFSYQGVNAGVDVVTASVASPALNSNSVNVLWINPTAAVSCSGVTGLFYNAPDNTGVFSSNGQNPLFTQSFNSLSFNDVALGENDLIGSLPVVNAILDANGNRIGDVPVSGNSLTLGLGMLASFNAVLVGNFVIKNAGTYTFSITSDDGFIMGVGGGAIRGGGSYIGVPASQTTVYSQLPIMGANNIGTPPTTVSIEVNFASPGIYPFEFDWANGFGQGGSTTFSVWVNGAPVVPITLPPAPANVIPQPTFGVLSLAPTTNGVYVVGGTATFGGFASGINQKAGQFTVNVVGDNVRSAMINGTAVLSGGELQPLWQYASNQPLTAPQTFKVTIANNSGSVTALTSANLMTFPSVTIDKFTAYDGSNPASPETSTSMSVAYGAPVGLCWKTSNAVEVTLNGTSLATNEAFIEILAGAGSRFDVPLTDKTYVLTATGADGSSISRQITVTVTNYKYFTHDWAFGPWYAPGNYWRLWAGRVFASATPDTVRIGQTSTIGLPAWNQDYVFDFWDEYLSPITGLQAFGPGSFDDRAWTRYSGLHEFVDNTISTDGTRPVAGPPVVVYEQNTNGTDSFTVAPATNTVYQFNLTGWWFWWFWDNFALLRQPSIGFTAGQFTVPYARNFHHVWAYSFHSAVNVDPGAQVTMSASTSSVNAGTPVTITYKASGAASITANFAQNEKLPLTGGSFTIFPDRTTDFVLTAKSVTGLVSTATVHVDVTPQVYYAPCLILPAPRVDSIAIDGLSTTTRNLSIREDEGVHVLEFFGDHFLGDRTPTPEIIGTVKVILTHQSGVAATALDIVELSAVANQYIRCKINTHAQTLAGIYTAYVMNDVNISTQKGPARSFTVQTKIPEFVMNKPISGYPGNAVTLFIDDYNPVRDVGLTILVGKTSVAPTTLGSAMSDNDFVTQMYSQVLGRLPDTAGFNFWTGQLAIGNVDRVGVMNAFLTSPEYQNSGRNVSVGIGTALTVPVNSSTAVAIGLRTNNGISPTQIEFIPIQPPPQPPVVVNSCPVITGLSSTSGSAGDTIDIFGTGFTVSSQIILGSGLGKTVTTTFVSSTNLRFALPTYVSTTVVSVMVQTGTCSDSYPGFTVFGLDTTPADPGVSPTLGPSGVRPNIGVPARAAATSIGVSNPVNLNSTSNVPTTVASSAVGTALTQPTVIATSNNTAQITTLSVNNVSVANTSSAQISTVNFVDTASARLQLK